MLRRTSDHALVHVFEDNSELEDKLAAKLLPRVIETSVPIAGGRFAAPVRILAPPRMQAGARYPVVVHVYGGPGYQKVKDAWSLGWAEHLATTRDIVYVIMDTRGTGGQSNEFLFSVSWGWWRAGHVTAVLTSDWCTAGVPQPRHRGDGGRDRGDPQPRGLALLHGPRPRGDLGLELRRLQHRDDAGAGPGRGGRVQVRHLG